MTAPRDPWSQPPLFGSKSEEPWVRRQATMFGPREASSLLKGLLVVLGVVVVVVPLLLAFFGIWGAAIGIWVLAVFLVGRIVWRHWLRRN